jgi:hypothetical protein
MTIWRMRIACWITKATNAHTGYVTVISFPLQQWLHVRASVLICTYIARLVLPLAVCFIIRRVHWVHRNTTWLQMAVLFLSSSMKMSHRHLLRMPWAPRSTNIVWMICLQRDPVLMSMLHPGTFPLLFILWFANSFCCLCFYAVLTSSSWAIEMRVYHYVLPVLVEIMVFLLWEIQPTNHRSAACSLCFPLQFSRAIIHPLSVKVWDWACKKYKIQPHN